MQLYFLLFLRASIVPLLLLAFVSCGKNDRSQNNGSGSQNSQNATQETQLKGVTLLSASLFKTLGSDKDKGNTRDRDGKSVSLFDTYVSNFGSTDGLRFGEIFADSPSANYFLALTILGDNAARKCQVEVLTNAPNTLCKCASKDEAKAMLSRAMPSKDFTKPELQPILEEFQQRCAQDYIGAVSSLIASLAFAARE